MKSFWKLLAAWWPDDETTSGIPSLGAPGTYTPVLDTTTREATWQLMLGGEGAEILVDEASGEILIDEDTGNVLYDG